jgi:hypothetical protein
VHLQPSALSSTDVAQGHAKKCKAPPPTTIPDGADHSGHGDQSADTVLDTPQPAMHTDQEADQVLTAGVGWRPDAAHDTLQPTANADFGTDQETLISQVEWGPDTVQDADMLGRGFFVDTKWRLAMGK